MTNAKRSSAQVVVVFDVTLALRRPPDCSSRASRMTAARKPTTAPGEEVNAEDGARPPGVQRQKPVEGGEGDGEEKQQQVPALIVPPSRSVRGASPVCPVDRAEQQEVPGQQPPDEKLPQRIGSEEDGVEVGRSCERAIRWCLLCADRPSSTASPLPIRTGSRIGSARIASSGTTARCRWESRRTVTLQPARQACWVATKDSAPRAMLSTKQ